MNLSEAFFDGLNIVDFRYKNDWHDVTGAASVAGRGRRSTTGGFDAASGLSVVAGSEKSGL